MADDPLDQVLRLVAEGRLTADEAAPILAALDQTAPSAAGDGRSAGTTGATGAAGGEAPTGSGAEPGATGRPETGRATSLRIEVNEAGRSVVNLRLPIAVGRFALDRVPGLSSDQIERVREALRSGLNGPVLEVDDGRDTVRIVLE
jgi:SHOCT-like domain